MFTNCIESVNAVLLSNECRKDPRTDERDLCDVSSVGISTGEAASINLQQGSASNHQPTRLSLVCGHSSGLAMLAASVTPFHRLPLIELSTGVMATCPRFHDAVLLPFRWLRHIVVAF